MGAGLPVYVLAIRNGYSVSNFIRGNFSLELTRFLVGSIAIILTIPVSSYISIKISNMHHFIFGKKMILMLIFSIACINCIENINSTEWVTKDDNIILNKKSETPIDLVTNNSSTLENSTNHIKQHVVTDATQHEQNKKTIEIQYNTFERQYNGYQEFFICLLDDINASATNLITINNEDVKDVIKKDLHIINIETITNIEKVAFTKKSYEFFNYYLKLCSKKFTNFYGKLDKFNTSCNNIYRNDDNIFFNNVLQKTKNLLIVLLEWDMNQLLIMIIWFLQLKMFLQ